ncbi:MAG TPA: glycosyltransferase family 39 protein, partial [Myxococcales bacterium]|nr:glycosyltransferase family 39 protein [Myxococcales bacterium]
MRSPALLLACIAILRSAGFAFGLLNIDESDFALIAKRIVQGAVPYAEIADIKPPLAYLAFTPAALFGHLSILPVHILGVLWLFATCVVVGRAARRLTGSDLAGACAPWLTLLAALCDVPSVSTELLMALPTAGALLFYVRAEQGGALRDAALAGACIGLASLFRQQAGIALVAFGLVWLWRGIRQRRAGSWLSLCALTAGFVAPWAVTVGVFASAGALAPFWDWVVARNLVYAQGGAPHAALLRAAAAIPLCVGSAAIPWFLATRETFSPTVRGPARAGVLLALWLSWISVSLGGRFYEHYFLQFMAPLGLVAAPAAAALLRSWPMVSRPRRAVFVAASVLPALILLGFSFARGAAGKYPEQEPRAREIAGWLAQNTGPEERLFIWGHYSPIYYLADRLPGTRYVT